MLGKVFSLSFASVDYLPNNQNSLPLNARLRRNAKSFAKTAKSYLI